MANLCMKLMYHKGWRTYVLSQILSVTHQPAVGLRSRCRLLTSVSFNYAPSLAPFMLPFRIMCSILPSTIISFCFSVYLISPTFYHTAPTPPQRMHPCTASIHSPLFPSPCLAPHTSPPYPITILLLLLLLLLWNTITKGHWHTYV